MHCGQIRLATKQSTLYEENMWRKYPLWSTKQKNTLNKRRHLTLTIKTLLVFIELLSLILKNTNSRKRNQNQRATNELNLGKKLFSIHLFSSGQGLYKCSSRANGLNCNILLTLCGFSATNQPLSSLINEVSMWGQHFETIKRQTIMRLSSVGRPRYSRLLSKIS